MSTTMTTLVRESGLFSGGRFGVLLELADCASHDGGGACESVETIAENARLSIRQAQRHVAALEAGGVIVREIAGGGRGGWAAWRLNVPMLEAAAKHANFAGNRQERRNRRKAVKQAAISTFGTATLPLRERVTSATPLYPKERVTSGAGKGDIRSAERVTSSAVSAGRTLYDPKEGLIHIPDPHQAVDKSTGTRKEKRRCTHGGCPASGCLYVEERNEVTKLVAAVGARLELGRKRGG
jgi:hypothetical protein